MTEPTRLGTFVWHELLTRDLEGSRAFYGPLFGWKIADVPLGETQYALIHAGDRAVAGMRRLSSPVSDRETSHWLSYVEVDDVDRRCRRAEELGGRIVSPPQDAPGGARFAVVQDREGALLALHKSARAPSPGQPPLQNGSFAWFELLSRDPDGARAFYPEVFCWSHITRGMEPSGHYEMFRVGEREVAGLQPMPTNLPTSPSWLAYVAVDSVDSTAARALELGGEVYMSPFDIFDVGRIAVLGDPQGATIAIWRRSAA